MAIITLDTIRDVTLDTERPPIPNYHALEQSREGLLHLANLVLSREQQKRRGVPPGVRVVEMFAPVDPLIPCAFNWFAVTLVNYLRLVGLIELLQARGWQAAHLANPANRSAIKKHCGDYVREVVPDIYKWRNKVAAHFAATDPFGDDNQATLEMSIMNSIAYEHPRYVVGAMIYGVNGVESELPQWSVTETFERIAPRLFPIAQQ